MADVMQRLFANTQKRRIPLMCTFELTRHCNLQCLHCYIPIQQRSAKTLSTKQVISALDELSRMGTLYLVFTGGEIFLRKDILTLCRHARRLRFDVRLFTNGTLISKRTAKQLAKIGISAVEISIYGRAATHDAITRKTGSWEKSINAIKILSKAGVKTVIKMPLMTANICEKKYVQTLANKLKVKLQLDAIITTMSDGNKAPLSLRLPANELKKLFKPSRWPNNTKSTEFVGENLICSAGRNMLAIGADGTIMPCIQLPLKLGNISRHPIAKLWSAFNPPVRKLLSVHASGIAVCGNCAMASFCQRCPGLALLEDGSLRGPSSTACLISCAKTLK